MDYNIYTLGDIDFVWSAFNGIALIFSKYTGVKEFMTTAAVLAGVSLFYRTWLWVLNPTKTELPVFSWFLGLVLFMMATVRVDVTIESVKSGEVRNVDGIPIFIAATATMTTNLSQGLLKDYKSAFDPLSPINLAATTLDDDLTLGPMIKFMKYMQWGGDSQGYCSLFPEPESGLGAMNLCATVQSIAYNCLKATQNSSSNIAGKETIFNDIFSSSIDMSMERITQAVNTGLKNASANVVGVNGSVSKTCKEAWSTVLRITGSAEARKTMKTIGQVNGIISPDEASGADGGVGFTDVMASANGMYGKVMSAHDAVTNLFVMSEMKNGASKYRTPLGIASDMQLFEASLKRTNTMASQGQLWMQLSGAAIAFLEMFAYMVAPFALLVLLALGGNGVAAAAKYLQLIIFVNIWPLTAVMVNAYIKKVVTADLDTWSTMSSDNNAVTWMGMPGLAETYSSYLSVASALYALIPVLTLFLMTQSIHPMMNATKGVTPDAPINNGHLTPQVWDAPNSGKSAFGDVQRTSLMSTGQGSLDGGSIKSNLEGLGSWNVGSGLSAAQGQSASRTASVMSAASNSYQSSLGNMSEASRSGSSGSQFSTNLQKMKSYADEIASSAAESVAKKHGISSQQLLATASSAVMEAGLSGGIAGKFGIGASGRTSRTDTKQDQIMTDLNKAISTSMSENTKLTEQFSNAASSVRSDSFTETNAFKENFAQMNQASQTMAENLSASVATNANVNSQSGIDTKQSVNLDMLSDSLGNKNFSDDYVRGFARKHGLDENAFMDKFNSYNDTFKSSNQFGAQKQRSDALIATTRDFSDQKIAVDTARGETAESNKSDLRETSSLLRGLISDFGANSQQLNPVINQLDKLGGGSTGTETIAKMEQEVPKSIDTGNVMSAGAVEGMGSNLNHQVSGGLEANKAGAYQEPTGSKNGVSAQNINETGDNAVRQHHQDQVDNRFSDADKAASSALDNVAPVIGADNASKLNARKATTENAERTMEDTAEAIVGKPNEPAFSSVIDKVQSRFGNEGSRMLSNNVPSYIDKIANDPGLSVEQKREELATQAVFTYAASTYATGAEKQQLREDSQKLLDKLGDYNVKWDQGDLKSINSSFDKYNRDKVPLSSVVKSNLNSSGPIEEGNGRGSNDVDRVGARVIEKNSNDGSFLNNVDSSARGFVQSVSDAADSVGATGLTEFATKRGWMPTTTNLAVTASNPGNMPSGLMDKVVNHMQMNDVKDTTSDRYKGMSSQALTNYEAGSQNSLRGIRQQLADSPEYGPKVADDFVKYIGSDLSNSGESYQSRWDKANNWLDEHRGKN
ncbi:conjugal transfer protein TraG [Salmonella enterica]|nr:conjugal transfer protein TraG [Salmonella enterica]